MTWNRRPAVVGVLAAALLLGCSATTPTGNGTPPTTGQEQTEDPRPRFGTTTPAQPSTVVPTTDAATAALTASRSLFATAPVVVLAAAGDAAAHEQAVELGAPVLVSDGEPAVLAEEVTRLEAEAVLTTGTVPEPVTAALEDTGAELVTDPSAVPEAIPGDPRSDVLVLSDGEPWSADALATARAAGAHVRELPTADPRTDPDTIEALAERPPSHVLALGSAFGDAERVTARVETAATGVQLPGGGQVVFPHRRMVALYGHPGTSALGVLGEQPVEDAVERAREVAADYQPLSDVEVVPSFEIITTIASSEAGGDGDYSSESTIEKIKPWVDVAGEAGIYVLLDLQPGRTDFLTQAKGYETLLAEPHVGLALDPEWRLRPGERHMRQIGSVSVDEVNAVSAWLAELTRTHRLPQKVLVLHQFRLSMIRERERLDTSHDELAIVIHADGNGTPEEKLATWDALRAGAPEGVHWAWKNFYDEDRPTFTPAETMDLTPPPVLVSYQ